MGDIRYILSWDIGIRNLSYCLLEKVYTPINKNIEKYYDTNKHIISLDSPYYKINEWKVLNIIEEKPIIKNYCSELKKNKKKCTKLAKYKYHKKLFLCGTHCKKYDPKYLKKIKIKKRKKIRSYSFQEISYNLFKKLDELNFQEKNIDVVIFENQPVLKNPIMKSIQIMVYSYFQLKINVESNKYIPLKQQLAKYKLLAYKGDPEIINISHIKDKYLRRKKQAVAFTRELIKYFPEYLTFFNTNKKKDDLSDSFLQGLYFMQTTITDI